MSQQWRIQWPTDKMSFTVFEMIPNSLFISDIVSDTWIISKYLLPTSCRISSFFWLIVILDALHSHPIIRTQIYRRLGG